MQPGFLRAEDLKAHCRHCQRRTLRQSVRGEQVEGINRSLFAGAGVLRALAAAAVVVVEREAEILRFGFGRLPKLHDEIVAVSFGQL